jgi:hypothetical protein
VQQLARFNECGPEIEMLTLATGATLAASTPRADTLLVLLSGGAAFDDATISGVTLIHTPSRAARAELTARSACRILAVTFG